MESQVELLLERFNVDPESDQRFFLIFDIDGTLRPDEIEAADHRHPKIDAKTAQKIKKINLESNFEIIILTARSYMDLFKSNFPKDITKYCGCGKQILENEILRYPREEFRQSYDETVMFIDILTDILGKSAVSKLDFLVVPGDFAINFSEIKYEKTKKEVMDKVNLVLKNSNRWKFTDMGKEVVFIDSKYHYDKGNAIEDIMDSQDFSQPMHVFMFGDSETDAKAMFALKEYQKQHPELRLKVSNISVGETLANYDYVDFQFDTYMITHEFIEKLYHKIFPKAK